MQDKRKMAVIIIMSAIVFVITLLAQMLLGQRAQNEQNRTAAEQTETPPVTTPATVSNAPAADAAGQLARQPVGQPVGQPAP